MNDTKSDNSYLKRGGMLLIMTYIGGYLANYFFNVAAARFLGPMGFGDFKVAEAFVSLGSMLVLMGGAQAIARFLPDQIRSGSGEGVWDFTRFYLKVILFSSAAILLMVYIGHKYHLSIVDGDNYHPILLATLAIPVAALNSFLGAVLQVAKRLDLAFIPWRVGDPLMRLALFLLYTWFIGTLGSFEAITIILIVNLLVALFSIYHIRRLALIPMKKVNQPPQHKVWLQVSMPMMLVMVMQILMRQADIYMIEFFAGEISVGHYAAAQTSGKVVNSLQGAVFGLLTPLIVHAINSGQDSIIELNRRGFSLLLKIVVPLAVTLSYFGHPILETFGHDTESAYRTLLILVTGYTFNSLLGFAALWLQYSGQEKNVVATLLGTLAINIMLNTLLIPIFDIEGAAFATSTAYLISGITLTILLYRNLGIFPWTRESQKTVAIAS